MIEDSNQKTCVVIIPVYKNKLDYDEERCVERYARILKRDIFFVAPFSLDKCWYNEKFPNVQFECFEDKYFTGTKSYNHLMLDIAFYKRFIRYDYMLIAQTDACLWANEDKLDIFMDMGFDYIGAPWTPERRIWEWIWDGKSQKKKFLKLRCCKKAGSGITMGNGGFCLRNIEKSIALITEYKWRKSYWFIKRNEDIFFGLFGLSNKSDFSLADVKSGNAFGREYNLRACVAEGDIPFGVHGWAKDFNAFDEMEGFLKENGVW